jgi:hypothetical protein
MSPTKVSIQPISEKEVGTIVSIGQRNSLDFDTDQLRHWWTTNPFYEQFRDVPAGWVLTTEDGSTVGGILNLGMMFDLNRQPVKIAIASAAAVDASYRGKSLLVFMAFLKQKNVDLCLVGSTNPATTKIFTAGSKRIPSPDDDMPLLWPVDYEAFIAASLMKKNIPGGRFVSWPAGVVLKAADLARRIGMTSANTSRIDTFDDRFDSFWERLRENGNRLRAVRTQATLEWRFRAELDRKAVAILTATKGRELSGYAVLLRQVRSDTGLSVYEIADLQAVQDDPETLKALIARSLEAAKEDGVQMVKLRGWNAAKRAAALSLKPYSYRAPLWQSYYKAFTPTLADAAGSADLWDFSPFEIF